MAGQLRLRSGTTSQHNTFTGAEGEVTYDTNKKTIVVHDGTTVGGEALLNTLDATEAVAGKAKIATTAIAQAGVNDTDIMTPLKVKGVSLGQGQTRKDVLASRLANTTYTNPDNTPIFITLGCTTAILNQARTYTVGGRTTMWMVSGGSIGIASTVEFMVLPNESYSVNIKPDVWWEISK